MPKILEEQHKYNRWWANQWVLPQNGLGGPKRVRFARCIGPQSFVYGQVELEYMDGSRELVHKGNAYKPRKTDVIVVSAPTS